VLPYEVAPPGYIQTVKVRLDLDDGRALTATFDRADALIQ
jgi:hypothetical protein